MASEHSIFAPAVAQRVQTPHATTAPAPTTADSVESQPGVVRRAFGPYGRHPRHWPDRQVAFITLSFVALLYLGLYHPYWARGGDSELYLVIARNLVRGDGYTYNGQPVALVPPLWSMMIAAGMWITSVVGILKLMMPALFLVFIGCAYFVLRRIASPWICAGTVALTALLHGLIVLTMWFHSDALFLALSWMSLLLALQARERFEAAEPRRAWLWRASLAILLLMAAIATRWPGLLWAPMIAFAFLHGRPLVRGQEGRHLTLALWPRRIDAMWIAAALACVLAAVTFFGLRLGLKVDAGAIDPRYDTFVTGHYDLVNQFNRPTVGTHLYRLLRGPEWLSVLYWTEPARTPGLALPLSRLAAVTVIPLAVAGVVGLYRRQWLWLGVAAAWLPIIMTWPHAIDRYSGPVAPFLICGTILGTIWLSRWMKRHFADRSRLAGPLSRLPYAVMAVPLLVCVGYNGGRYGLEVWARLDYFDRYEAGIQPGLNRIAQHIRQNQPATGGEVGLTRTGVRFGRGDPEEERYQRVRGLQRNLVFLMDRPAIDLPARDSFSVEDPAFIEWAARRDVRWFVEMPRHRRFLVHLRDLPEPVYRVLALVIPDLPAFEPATPEEIAAEQYRLYELIGGEVGLPVLVRPVDVSQWPQEVLVIPGLEDVREIPGRAWVPIPYN